jgi:hypothetical protein
MAPPQETLKRETNQSHEQAVSFDILASVNMLRYDIEQHRTILPETMERVHDEELSYIAEGIDLHSHTSFDLKNDPELGLVFFDKGRWRPYLGLLMTGLGVAEREASEDPRKTFLAENADRDLKMGYKMEELQPGGVLIWDSEFAEKECARYGEEFMVSLGLQPSRRMGFIYRAEKHHDGSLTLESHTIDNSDSEIFEAVRALQEYDKEADMETLIRTYDGNMRKKYGAEYRAGRLKTDQNTETNAWEFVKSNKPLFNYYFSEIIKLAYSDLEDYELREAKKNLTIGVWARTRELLDDRIRGIVAYQPTSENLFVAEQRIAGDVYHALGRAIARGDVMIGCGGALVASSELDDISSIFDSIFGKEKSDTSLSYTFNKKMYCVVCQAPPKKEKETKKMCGPCGICRGCDSKMRTATASQAAASSKN